MLSCMQACVVIFLGHIAFGQEGFSNHESFDDFKVEAPAPPNHRAKPLDSSKSGFFPGTSQVRGKVPF